MAGLQQRSSFDIPPQMVDTVGSGEHRGTVRGKRDSDQVVPGDHKFRPPFRRYANDTALAFQRGGNIQIALDIEGHALRTPKATVVDRDVPSGMDLVHRV